MKEIAKVNDNLTQVVQASELISVNLKTCRSECHVYPTLVDPKNTALEIRPKTNWSIGESGDVLFCFVEISVVGKATVASPGIEIGSSLFEIGSAFAVTYKMSRKDLSDEAIGVFASQNALFNSYPFLREMVSTLTLKMGIQPVVLPLLKFAASPSVASKK